MLFVRTPEKSDPPIKDHLQITYYKNIFNFVELYKFYRCTIKWVVTNCNKLFLFFMSMPTCKRDLPTMLCYTKRVKMLKYNFLRKHAF